MFFFLVVVQRNAPLHSQIPFRLSVGHLLLLLDLVVSQGRLDGILGQHGAMQLDGRQTQLLGDVRILQLSGLVDGLALHPLGGQGAAGNGRSTAEGLELGVHYLAVLVHLDLQFHHIAAGWCSDQAGAHSDILLVQRSHVARVFVVLNDLWVKIGRCVSHQGVVLSRLSLCVPPETLSFRTTTKSFLIYIIQLLDITKEPSARQLRVLTYIFMIQCHRDTLYALQLRSQQPGGVSHQGHI